MLGIDVRPFTYMVIGTRLTMATLKRKIGKKQKRRERRNQKDLLTTTVNLLSDGILLIDKKHKILFANKQALHLTGLQRPAIRGKQIEHAFTLEDPANKTKITQLTIPATEPLTLNASTHGHDLSLKVINIHHAPGFSKLNNRAAAAIILTGATERASTTAGQHALRHHQFLGHLTIRIAHDFNNSLTSILGNAELVQETLETINNQENGNPDTAAARALVVNKDVMRKCLEMAAFIRKLQAYSQQEPQQKQTLDINTAIQEALSIARKLLGRKIDIEFLPAENLPLLHAERTQIDQILFILLDNSKERMPSDGRITIQTEPALLDYTYTSNHPGSRPGPHVLLTVTDTGNGIAPEGLSKPFDLFASTAQDHDSGLRLATVYAIVKQLGGYIDVESWIGKGTRFEIYFPLPTTITASKTAPAENETRRKTSRPGPLARKSRRKALQRLPLILVAEDQEDIRRSMERYITKGGYRIELTSSGTQALNRFGQLTRNGDKPALVVADLGLPGIDGRTLCKKIRAAHPRTSLLLTSGHVILLDKTKTKTLDDDFNFIQKPFDATTLLQTIDRVLQ
jgi:two-component system cell cycle sensor histidine kinase/response regulator CckA